MGYLEERIKRTGRKKEAPPKQGSAKVVAREAKAPETAQERPKTAKPVDASPQDTLARAKALVRPQYVVLGFSASELMNWIDN